jgi:hypothetical protein
MMDSTISCDPFAPDEGTLDERYLAFHGKTLAGKSAKKITDTDDPAASIRALLGDTKDADPAEPIRQLLHEDPKPKATRTSRAKPAGTSAPRKSRAKKAA